MTGAALIAIVAVGAISAYDIMEWKIGGGEVQIGVHTKSKEVQIVAAKSLQM